MKPYFGYLLLLFLLLLLLPPVFSSPIILENKKTHKGIVTEGGQVTFEVDFDHDYNTFEILLDSYNCSSALYLGLNSEPTQISYQDYCASTSYDLEHKVPLRIFFNYLKQSDSIHILLDNTDTKHSLNYSIVAIYSNQCPNDCNGHGSCDNTTGNCICSSDHYLNTNDCSDFQAHLEPNNTLFWYNNSNIDEWYRLNTTMTKANEMKFSFACYSVDELASPAEITFFVNHNQSASISNYVYSESGVSSTVVFDKPNQVTGEWNVLIFGKQAANCSFSFDESQKCPNDCSGHGTCKDTGICDCGENYKLYPDCSVYMRELYDFRINEDISFGEVKYFFKTIQDANLLNVFYSDTSQDDDDLVLPSGYLRQNEVPTLYNYVDSRQNNTKTARMLITKDDIPQGLKGTWYLMLKGVDNGPPNRFEFVLEILESRICPRQCSNHGKCINGTCRCDEGWVLNDCSSQDIAIADGNAASGKVSFDEWDFYFVHVRQDALQITLFEGRTNSMPGSVFVYAKKTSLPSENNFDYRNNSFLDSHEIFIPASSSQGNQTLWQIGVTGSPFLGYDQATYTLHIATGCNTYPTCSMCVQDTNCGWCSETPGFSKGFCVAGQSEHPFDHYCNTWFFDTCSSNDENSMEKALFYILFIGIIISLLVMALIALWNRYYHRYDYLRESDRVKNEEKVQVLHY